MTARPSTHVKAALGYEVVFDMSPNAAGAAELRAMARELAMLAELR
ncbi:hypothetical protein [Corallococcus sp. RDP092CA]